MGVKSKLEWLVYGVVEHKLHYNAIIVHLMTHTDFVWFSVSYHNPHLGVRTSAQKLIILVSCCALSPILGNLNKVIAFCIYIVDDVKAGRKANFALTYERRLNL